MSQFSKRAGAVTLLASAVLLISCLQPAVGQAPEQPIGILLAAGDIAACSNDPTKSGNATADLIKREIAAATALGIEVRVLALGDLAYDHGSEQSVACFKKSWGQFTDKILPVPGNHDYETKDGAAYYRNFETTLKELGAGAGKAYYSLRFPAPSGPADDRPWLLIGLDSNTDTGASTDQVKWLKAELSKTPAPRCVLAFSRAFFYSSGRHGHGQNSSINLTRPLVPEKEARAFFAALHEGRASLFVAGHDHHYEQLGRANAGGKPSDKGKAAMAPDGVRSFVVGTGGTVLHNNDYKDKWAFTEAYDLKSYGVLKIELFPDSYRWAFLPTKPNQASLKIVKDVTSDKCNRP